MDPRGIAELYPDWRERGFPILSEVGDDWAELLRAGGGSTALRGVLCPPQLKNHGNVIVSLNQVVRWLAEQAEEAGVMIQPGFPAAEALYDGDRVVGVDVRDSGLAKDGSRKGNFEAGARVEAAVTVFAEGTRGSLAKQLFARHDLYAGKNPQTYGTGVKELWQVRPEVGAELGLPAAAALLGVLLCSLGGLRSRSTRRARAAAGVLAALILMQASFPLSEPASACAIGALIALAAPGLRSSAARPAAARLLSSRALHLGLALACSALAGVGALRLGAEFELASDLAKFIKHYVTHESELPATGACDHREDEVRARDEPQ